MDEPSLPNQPKSLLSNNILKSNRCPMDFGFCKLETIIYFLRFSDKPMAEKHYFWANFEKEGSSIHKMLGVEICRFLTSIWRGFFSISLNLHSTGDSAVGFSTGEISHVDESVIESGQKMDNTEHVHILLSTNLRWTEVGLLLLLNFNFLLWWLSEKQG